MGCAMYDMMLSKIVGFTGAGPRKDLFFSHNSDLSGSAKTGGSLAGTVFQIFGPLIVAFLLGLLFVGFFQVEFSQFSNWYIRIIFTISILMHLVLLFALARELGLWGVLLVIVSFAFTVLQILAALSLVQMVLGVELLDGSLLQNYRGFILNIAHYFGANSVGSGQIEQVGGAVYKYSYDVGVQLGSAAVLAVIAAIAKSVSK